MDLRMRLEEVIRKAATGAALDRDMKLLHATFEEHWTTNKVEQGNISYADVIINAPVFLVHLDRKLDVTGKDQKSLDRRVVVYDLLLGIVAALEGAERAARVKVRLDKHITDEAKFVRKFLEHIEQRRNTLTLMGYSADTFTEDKLNSISEAEIKEFLDNEKVLEAQIQSRQSSLPWAGGEMDGAGNFWGFHTDKVATGRTPPDGLLPARLQPNLKRAWQGHADNHLIAIMQHKNAYVVRYTIEFDRTVRNLSRPEDWRLSLERRDACKYAMDSMAEELGILFALEGLEAHGATKGQTRSRQVGGSKGADEEGDDAAKKKATKRKRTTSEKKKNVANPRMGGLGELLDEHEEDELAQAEEIQAIEDEKNAALDKADEETVRKGLAEREAAAKTKIEKAREMLKENQMKKLSEFITEKKNTLKTAEERGAFEDNAEKQLSLWLDFIRQELLELYKIPVRTLTDNAYIKCYEKAAKALREALPNVRRGLSHLELTLVVAEDAPLPVDPCYPAKQITAPLVLRCVAPPRNTPAARERTCRACGVPALTPAGAVVMPPRSCTKATEGRPNCEWEIKCMYCTRSHPEAYYALPPYLDKKKYPDEFRRRQYGALRYSWDHKGGFEWKDVKTDINLNRSIKHWKHMLLYSLKSWRCKLVRAWLACVGRNHQRLSVLYFYGDKRDKAWNQMVRNWVVQLYIEAKQEAPDEYFSLSPDADEWVYSRVVDRPVTTKKKDKYFFLDRLANYMRKHGYYLAKGSEAVLKKMPNMERSAELCVQHFFSNDQKIPPEETFMGILVKDDGDDWLGAVSDYGHIFGPNPALRARFPFARRDYRLIEGNDFFFAMFRRGVKPKDKAIGPVEWPDWLPRDGLSQGDEQSYKLMPKYMADGKTLNRQTLEWADKLLGPDGICAHGLPIDMKEFTRPPIQWFAAIGKYYKDPEPIYYPPEYDVRGRMMPRRIKEHTTHMGARQFMYVMDLLRSVLGDPLGDGQPWPWFWGTGGTGKSSFGTKVPHSLLSYWQAYGRRM